MYYCISMTAEHNKVTVLVLGAAKVGQNHLLTQDLESPLLIPYQGKPLFYYFESHFGGGGGFFMQSQSRL